ncbi:hypothetical protein CKO25_18735 [Thiocapsa imhoffii]|uniref:Uncharacterized protein n=1 Tax=Thiocapsa imhoffii TaxID=382777 RepID=A0A9X1BA64_9GAMM|nr:hypothetical protein [Thiocapsa imhoffii]MBK1646637.1 hypothetical protein [Thiocapsa imhoffii]
MTETHVPHPDSTSVPATAPLTEIDMVAFRLGAQRFVVDARQIRGIGESTDPRVPALAPLIGLPMPSARARERALQLRHASAPETDRPDTLHCVRVEEPVSLQTIPIDALFPLPRLITRLSTLPCVRGLARLPDSTGPGFSVLLDLRRIPAPETASTGHAEPAARPGPTA